jgi:hypothetical protein
MADRTLTLSQQKLEDAINDHETLGQFLVDAGILDQEEFNDGLTKDERFRLKIEADAALADAIVEGKVDADEVRENA